MVVNEVMTRAIVETRLVFTLINVGVTFFSSVTRLTRAQEVTNKVRTRGIIFARARITLIDFYTILAIS